MLSKRKRRNSTKIMTKSAFFCVVQIVGITSVISFQPPPVQADNDWQHFSPSSQISQSDFHPVNLNGFEDTYHNYHSSLSENNFNQESIRRQFDAANDDNFSKLSNLLIPRNAYKI